jgi:hypothetical protein
MMTIHVEWQGSLHCLLKFLIIPNRVGLFKCVPSPENDSVRPMADLVGCVLVHFMFGFQTWSPCVGILGLGTSRWTEKLFL